MAGVSSLRVASSRGDSRVQSTREHPSPPACEQSEFPMEVTLQFFIERVQGKSEREKVSHGKKERGGEKGGCNYFAIDWQGLLSL